MTIVSNIRQLLIQHEGISAEDMSGAAAEYSAEVQAVNRRLDVCARLIRQGLRSEAIQQARMRPDLLEAATQLDFDRFDEWVSYLNFLSIDLPPQLDRAKVQILQAAFVEEQPLDQLMRQHRLLAIGRAPIAWRLKVLRMIADRDSSNPVWQEDIEAWERVRLREIDSDINRLVRSRDIDQAAMLKEEVLHTDWLANLPDELREKTRRVTQDIEFEYQSARLDQIAQQLSDAQNEQDIEKATNLRLEWLALLKQLVKPADPSVLEIAEPALLWLRYIEEENQAEAKHQSAINNLHLALEERSSIADIEKAFQLASAGERDLEFGLINRYRSTVAELQQTKRSRTILGVASVLVTACIIGVGLGYWQWQSGREREIQNTVQQVSRLLDEQSIADADRLINEIGQQSDYIVKDSRFVAQAARLETLKNQEAERLESFSKLVAQADLEDPSAIDVRVLNEAEKLAKSDAERTRIFEIRRKVDNYSQALMDQQSNELLNRVADIKKEFDTTSMLPNSISRNDGLFALLTELKGLSGKFPRASRSSQIACETLSNRVDGFLRSSREALAELKKQQRFVTEIAKASTLTAYSLAVSQYVSQLPNDPKTLEYDAALKEQMHWKRWQQWDDFATRLGEFAALSTSAQGVRTKQVIENTRKVIDMADTRVDLAELERYAEYVVRRTELCKDTADALRQAVLSELGTVVADGMRFFARKESVKMLQKSSGSVGIAVIADSDGTEATRTFKVREAQLSEEPSNFIVQLCADLETPTSFEANWERGFASHLNQLLKSDSKVDADVAVQLAVELLQVARQGSPTFDDMFDQMSRSLTIEAEKRGKWFEEKAWPNSVPEDLHTRAFETLKQAVASHDKRLERWKNISNYRMRWFGSIQRTLADEVVVQSQQGLVDSDLLFVLVPSTKDPNATALRLIGRTSSEGEPIITTDDPALLIMGRPVFLLSAVDR